MIIELLTKVNSSYLVALAVLVCLVVEGIKASGRVATTWLPVIAGGIGWVSGVVIAIVYGESLALTSLNGLIAGLLAAGGVDFAKALWQLPEALR